MHYEETTYGFEYGAAKIERIASDEKKGWVVVGLKTPKAKLDIYVTKTGKVRVHNEEGLELLPNEPRSAAERPLKRPC